LPAAKGSDAEPGGNTDPAREAGRRMFETTLFHKCRTDLPLLNVIFDIEPDRTVDKQRFEPMAEACYSDIPHRSGAMAARPSAARNTSVHDFAGVRPRS
jgi:hypothetical protein